jgi:hypothetical protein
MEKKNYFVEQITTRKNEQKLESVEQMTIEGTENYVVEQIKTTSGTKN